jgi:hypothetical protein
LLWPIIGGRILPRPGVFTGLRGRDVAEKLPVIIDNRGDNTVVNALRRLLPSLQKMDLATGVFEVGASLLLR